MQNAITTPAAAGTAVVESSIGFSLAEYLTLISNLIEPEAKFAKNAVAIANEYVIDCQELADAAADDLADVKRHMKDANELRMSQTRPLDDTKKKIMELFNPVVDLLGQAEAKHKANILAWNKKEQARIEAERKAAEEAARLIAEQAQKEAEESARQAEEARKAAETAIESGDTATAQEALSTAVQAQAQAETAAQVAETVTHMAAPMAKAVAKTKGVSTTKVWKAECTDLLALVKAIAAGDAPIALIEFAQAEANKRAKALQTEFKAAGVRVYFEESVSARAK